MMRRKAKTKRIFLSVFLAIALCLFAFAGCQDTGKVSSIPEEDPVQSAVIPSSAPEESPKTPESSETPESIVTPDPPEATDPSEASETSEIPETPDEDPLYGEYFGRDVDECYEAWDIDPDTDIEVFDIGQYLVFFNDPVEYLGKEFTVNFGYFAQIKNAAFQNNKFTNITFERDYENMPDEVVLKETAELFAAVEDKYGSLGEGMIGVDKTVNNTRVREWHLPEEYKKVDAAFVEQLEEHYGQELTYCVKCSLEYKEGRLVFSVRHGFDFADEFGFHEFAASRQE